MKTQNEIEEYLKKEEKESSRGEYCRDIFMARHARIEALKWVLEEPKYKRTICDLTNEELLQLAKIVFELKDYEKIEFDSNSIEKTGTEYSVNMLYNFQNVNFYFRLLNTEDDTKKLYEVNIYDSLDINIQENGIPEDLCNIVQFADTIRNMLSMEKTDED